LNKMWVKTAPAWKNMPQTILFIFTQCLAIMQTESTTI